VEVKNGIEEERSKDENDDNDDNDENYREEKWKIQYKLLEEELEEGK
jgi:hypothetical protein